MNKFVSLTAALADAREHRISAVINGYVVYHFHYKHGFSDARAAEQTYFTALCIRNKQVYYLNSGFKQFGSRLLLGKTGSGSVYRQIMFRRNGTLFVDRSAENIHNTADNAVANGNLYTLAVRFNLKITAKSLGSLQSNGAHSAAAQMRRNLRVLVVLLNDYK